MKVLISLPVAVLCWKQLKEKFFRVLQAYKAAFDEFPGRHRFPAVVIGIADDKAGKHEEKIDGQVAVVDDLVHMAGGVGFKDVEPYDDNGGYAAQPVKNVVVVFFTAWGNGRMLQRYIQVWIKYQIRLIFLATRQRT